MTDGDDSALTIETFLPHLREAMTFAVGRWNAVKLQNFEDYFEISFQDYMARHDGKTVERTKVVSPAFCSVLNNRLEQVLQESYSVHETNGSDLQVRFNGAVRTVEQKLTTGTGESNDGFYWTGNHVSSKSGWHMLIRTLHAPSGIITHAYAGMLDYDAASSSNWKQGSGNAGQSNYGTLTVYRTDTDHLYDAIGEKESAYHPSATKVKFSLHSFES